MKKVNILLGVVAVLALGSGCDKDGIDDNTAFVSTAASSTPGQVFDISDDNSGRVWISPTGNGASSYTVLFGHGAGADASATVQPGNKAVHIYPEGAYTVTINTKDIAGRESSAAYPLQVTYRVPEDIKVTMTGEGHALKVKAEAKYAASFLVYFGDVPNEVGTPLVKDGEVSHVYANAGNYNVKVVALSGGAAKAEQTNAVSIYNPFGLPITFDDPTVVDFFGTFGGGQAFAFVANPSATGLNPSAKVGKFTRGFESWSGTYSPLNTSIDLSQGRKIKVLVYNPNAALIGKSLNVELESGTVDNGIAILRTAITTSGAWEELVFDFSTIAALPANAKFNQLVLRFNDAFDGDGVGGTGSVIYLDNFRQTN